MSFRFNIRVYGVLINKHKQVLVSDEFIRGQYFTKFPGGGLEFGEGTRDCLKREFQEEMNLEVAVGDHIYTTFDMVLKKIIGYRNMISFQCLQYQ